MPVLATILMGIAGQAAWKIVNHFYERMTGKTAAAPSQPSQSFERSLSDASAKAAPAVSTPVSAPGAMLASAGFPAFVPGAVPGAAPAIKSAIDAYRGIQRFEAP
jgi:hypothetical protein